MSAMYDFNFEDKDVKDIRKTFFLNEIGDQMRISTGRLPDGNIVLSSEAVEEEVDWLLLTPLEAAHIAEVLGNLEE